MAAVVVLEQVVPGQVALFKNKQTSKKESCSCLPGVHRKISEIRSKIRVKKLIPIFEQMSFRPSKYVRRLVSITTHLVIYTNVRTLLT